MKTHRGHDLVVSGLAWDDARSLAQALAAAAIVANPDIAGGSVVISRSANRVFSIDEIVLVIGEWLDADHRRQARIGTAKDVRRDGDPQRLALVAHAQTDRRADDARQLAA